MAIRYSGQVVRQKVVGIDQFAQALVASGYQIVQPLYAQGFGKMATFWLPGNYLQVGTGGAVGFCYDPHDPEHCGIYGLECPYYVPQGLPCTPFAPHLQSPFP
jgi:hypothetical protein